MPTVTTVARIGLEIGLGLLYCNFVEWFAHRYILHGLGKKKNSISNFHWHDHHKNARRNNTSAPLTTAQCLNGMARERKHSHCSCLRLFSFLWLSSSRF